MVTLMVTSHDIDVNEADRDLMTFDDAKWIREAMLALLMSSVSRTCHLPKGPWNGPLDAWNGAFAQAKCRGSCSSLTL